MPKQAHIKVTGQAPPDFQRTPEMQIAFKLMVTLSSDALTAYPDYSAKHWKLKQHL